MTPPTVLSPSPAGGTDIPAAALRFHLAEGWEIDQTSGGDFIVNKPGVGGYVASLQSDSIASVVLAHLARDLLAALSQPESVQQAGPSDAPSIPGEVLTYIHAYGDSRADDDGRSALRIGECVLALRRWGAALSVQPGATGGAA
jgi:hypothetical protein